MPRSYTVREICAAMEAWAPAGYAYDWDKVGLQTGDPDTEVSHVLTCLSITEDALKAARKAKAKMIVAHHPLIWEPLKRLDPRDPHTRLCLELAQEGIACFASHTNLDVVPGGVNHTLALTLGLWNARPLFPAAHARQVKLVTFVPESHLTAVRDALSKAGAGVIGDYKQCSFSTPGTGTFIPGMAADPFCGEPLKLSEEAEIRLEMLVSLAHVPRVVAALMQSHPYEEPAYDLITLENRDPAIGLGMRGELRKAMTLKDFAALVCKSLDLTHARVGGSMRRKVRRVAVLGGSGGGEVAKLPPEVEVYVTGDLKYHDVLEARARGLAVIDAGHAGTEKGIALIIARHLLGRFLGLRVTPYVEPEYFQAVLRK